MAAGTGIKEGQGITAAWSAIAAVINILDVSMDGVSVSDIYTGDQDTTGYKTYVGSTLKEGGTYTFNINWNLLDQAVLMAAIGTTDTLTITYPKHVSTNTTAPTDAFSCYINDISKTGGEGELINGTLKIKVAGDITTVSEAA